MNSRLNAQYLPSYRLDMKSYMSFRLVPKSVTLNALNGERPLFCVISLNLVVSGAHCITRTHQEMRDSEREPFYDDIARTYFKILKNTACGIRTRDRKAFGRIITVHDHCASDKISSYTHIIVPNV